MSTKKFIKDSLLVMVIGLCSRILGWIRDSFLLAFLGTGAFSDAFHLSIKIPNAFRKAISEGAVNTVLLPQLRELEKDSSKQRIYGLISNVFILFSTCLFLFYFLERFFQTFFLSKIAPGFCQQQVFFYVKFIKITSFTSFIYFCYSICASILQFRGCFFFPSIAVAVLNFSLILSIGLSMFFELPIYNVTYFYFFSTILMMMTTLIPCVCYNFFQESFLMKFCISFILFCFICSFVFINEILQIVVICTLYSLYFYFAKKANFFSSDCLKDLKSFFYFFFPVFFMSSLFQINDVIAMTFGSFFPPGSMTLIMRSGKVMQLPIAFIVPIFITLFSHLNGLSEQKENHIFLKRVSLLFVFVVTLLFSFICFYFTNFLINFTFLYRVTNTDMRDMVPLVKLYSLGLPAILMTRLFQIFFFVEKKVGIPVFLALSNTLFYIIFIKFFVFWNFSLSSIVLPFILCSWITFFIYLVFAKKRGFI